MAINKFVLSNMMNTIADAMTNGQSFELTYVNLEGTEIAKEHNKTDDPVQGFNLVLIDPVEAYENGFFNDDDEDDEECEVLTETISNNVIDDADSLFSSDTLYPQISDDIKDLKNCIAKIDAMIDAYHLKVSMNDLINRLSASSKENTDEDDNDD